MESEWTPGEVVLRAPNGDVDILAKGSAGQVCGPFGLICSYRARLVHRPTGREIARFETLDDAKAAAEALIGNGHDWSVSMALGANDIGRVLHDVGFELTGEIDQFGNVVRRKAVASPPPIADDDADPFDGDDEVSLDWHRDDVEVEMGGETYSIPGVRAGSFGVFELADADGWAVAYLIDGETKRALSPFESVALACVAAEVAGSVRMQMIGDAGSIGVATHRAWRKAGFFHTDRRTGAGDPIWGIA